MNTKDKHSFKFTRDNRVIKANLIQIWGDMKRPDIIKQFGFTHINGHRIAFYVS